MSETPAKAGQVEPLPQQQEGLNLQATQTERRADYSSFYRAEKKHLIAFLMHLGARPHEADDLAHDALIKLLPDQWQYLEYPRAYLRIIAFRIYLRQAKKDRVVLTDRVPDLPGGLDPVNHLEMSERAMVVLNAISELPPVQRTVMAFVISGAENDEIATALNMKPGAVYTNTFRARVRLKIALGLAKGEKDA
ncbi:RNA polymerase sigma factor [Streptomyces hawaiiensis]|uniref:RNA polymerase sigma factor n=1 Tax=Streptomyces hawaiiensis TaxID=67305 RepID=UPI003665518F